MVVTKERSSVPVLGWEFSGANVLWGAVQPRCGPNERSTPHPGPGCARGYPSLLSDTDCKGEEAVEWAKAGLAWVGTGALFNII